jgi:hypothetical protein
MSGFVDLYTSFFSALGLDNEFTRFFFGAAVGLGTQFLLKPSISYTRNGKAKAFISETYFPWYFFAIVPGLVFALFF